MLQYTEFNYDELESFVGKQNLNKTAQGYVQLLTKDGVVYIEPYNWVGYISGQWHVFSEQKPEL